jgi:hypothetical protein
MSEKYGQDQPWHVTREPNVEPSYEELTDRIEELEAKLAKAVGALALYACDDGCSECPESERDRVSCGWTARAALALATEPQRAALDRLIREAEERGAQKAREECAEALWDACPLDQIVNGAYVKRAQHVIRNRGKRDE